LIDLHVLICSFDHHDVESWATAQLNQAPIIFSEDFHSGSILDGVRVINFFAPDCDLKVWV
jgi:predicted nucleic acid-binding protein